MEMKVRDIMSTPIVTEDEDTPVIDIARDMKELGIGSVVITTEGNPAGIGIITERDIALKVLLKDRKASEVKAKEIMSSPLITIEPDIPVEKACELIAEKRIKEVYEELRELIGFYRDDRELREVYDRFEELYNRMEEPLRGQRKRLETVLRKMRHITYWRKQQSISSFASGVFWFHDYRHGVGKELRLPFKRTRP